MTKTTGPVGSPAAHVIETEVGGDLGLYDARQERVLILNRTASDVWLLCDGHHTPEEIARVLARVYNVSPGEIRDDVDRTLTRFRTEGFLQ